MTSRIRRRVRNSGNLQDTIETIKEALALSIPQTGGKALQLKGSSLYDSGRRIYEYLVQHIAYKLDEVGFEEVRTAAETEASRFTGVDCEDYTIYVAALAHHMGYKAWMEIVAFNGKEAYTHVYPVISDGIEEVVIDPTPDLQTHRRLGFNRRPPQISKTMKIDLIDNTTPIQGHESVLYGFGAVEAPSKITQILLDKQSKMVEQVRSQPGAAPYIAPELRKLRVAIMLNGATEQKHFVQLLPAMADIDGKGEILWKKGVNLREVADFVDLSEAVYGAEAQGESNPTLTRLNGLGLFSRRGRQKAKDKLKELKDKIVSKAKRGNQNQTTATKKPPKQGRIAKAIAKINPAGVATRNAFLLAMKTDFAGMATKLKWGYLSEKAAIAKGFDLTTLRGLKSILVKAESTFERLGGKAENLKNAILKGGKQSLGVLPAIPAILSAASSVLKPLLGLIKKIDLKKLFQNVKGKGKEKVVEKAQKAFELAAKGAALIKKGGAEEGVVKPAIDSTFNDPTEAQIVEQTMNQNTSDDTSSSGGKYTLYIVGGVAAVAALGLAIYFYN